MLLVRYFLFTGVMLLGLLFAANWYLPKPATEPALASASLDTSIIRIHSRRRWPSAVNFGTSAPMPKPIPQMTAQAVPQVAPPAQMSSAAPLPARVREASASATPAPKKYARHRRHPVTIARAPMHEMPRQFAFQSNWFASAW